ncbi:MAG: flippase [Nitrospira sp.]|nr:flippase [Nitrospira sp.]
MEVSSASSTPQAASLRATDGSQLVRVARGGVLIFISMFFGLGLNYIYSICLARMFDAEVFGLYTLGLAAFSVLSVVSVAGLDRAILRFIPAVNDGDRITLVGPMVKYIARMSLIIGCVAGFTLLGLSSSLSTKIFGKPTLTDVLILFSFAIPLFSLSMVLLSTLQALQDNRWRSFVKYGCEPIVKFSLTVVFVWLGWGVYGALVAFGIALCLTIVLAYIPLRRYVSLGCHSFQHRAFHEKVVRFAAPLLGALIVASLAARSDVFMIGYWLPPEQIGFYGAAFQTASIIALILGSLDSAATPLISRAIAGDNQSCLQSLLQSVLRWSVSMSLPMFLVFVLFPAEVLSIFGDQFHHASYCLVVLAMSQVINAASGSSNTALVLAGYSKLVMWNSIWLGVTQIVFNVMLVPLYGMTGAAVGTATALTLVSVVRFYECSLLLKVKMIEREIWKPVAAAAITFALVSVCKLCGLPVSWWILAATSVGLYTLITTLLGLHEQDRNLLNHLKETVYRHGGPRLCV